MSKSKIVLLHNDKRDNRTAQSEYSLFYNYCEEYGIQCFNTKSFFKQDLEKDLKPEDILIVYIDFPDENSLIDRFKKIKCKKFLRTLDTYNSDGIPHKKSIEKSKVLEIDKFIVAATSKKLDFALERQGIDFIFLTHTFDYQKYKNYHNSVKNFDISISGVINWEVYPTRTRIFDYLRRHESQNMKISFLPHPGYEKSKMTHDIIGDKYINFLSQSWLSVVCRGGWRDGLVSKYLEAGLAYSLPVGDLPTYMNKEMKELIVNIEHDDTNLEIKEKIYRELENKNKLMEKIEEYRHLCEKYHDYRKTIPDFKKDLLKL